MKRLCAIPLATAFFACALVVSAANAEDCIVHSWKPSHHIAGGVWVDGRTTCECGRVHIRLFDGDSFIGGALTEVRYYTFKAWIKGAHMTSQMTIKATVDTEWCR